MKWVAHSHKHKMKRLRTEKWHRYFAWYPVKVDAEVYWLTHVGRKIRWHQSSYDGAWNRSPEYTTLEDARKMAEVVRKRLRDYDE